MRNQQLAGSKPIACNQYAIADIAIFPRLRNWENHGITRADYPHLKKWIDAIAARPAVQRGVRALAALHRPITGDKASQILFDKTKYQSARGAGAMAAAAASVVLDVDRTIGRLRHGNCQA